MRIPLSSIDLSDLERGYAEEALSSGWISSAGSYVDAAERALAAFCGVSDCTVVCSGTAALHLALICLGVHSGDEVIVPGMTFVSPAAAVVRRGAIPVIADVEEVSWCLDPAEVERLITPKTKGVIAVDVLGHPADFDALHQVCTAHGLFLVEDAAEAHGSKYKGRRTGSLGDISTFSFFANKTLACGEGGAVLTSNPDLAQLATLIRNHGMTRERPYWHEVIGDNFLLSNLLAAILFGQIQRGEEIVQRKKQLAQMYQTGLADIDGLAFRPAAEWAEVVSWLEPVQVLPENKISRDELVRRLRANGIDARALWTPLVDLPPYRQWCIEREISTPVARRLLSELFWLPTYSAMSDDQLEIVVQEVHRAMEAV